MILIVIHVGHTSQLGKYGNLYKYGEKPCNYAWFLAL